MYLDVFFLPFLVLFLPILLKQLLLWMYLWQLKEYRGDKMQDYISLKESSKVIMDKWSMVRLGGLVVSSLLIFVDSLNAGFINPILMTIITYLVILLMAVETLEFCAKIYFGRNIPKPKFSSKAKLHTALAFITGAVILPWIFESNSLFLNLLVFNLIILMMPLIIGYWLLVIFPLDYWVKLRVFQKAKQHRIQFDQLETIAISGAFGKSSVKEFVSHILSTKHKVLYNHKNQNSNVSCARWTMKLDAETDFFVCELGAYKKGDGIEISKFIRPTASIVTGLNIQHYSLFGSQQNIIEAESESLNFLTQDEPAFLNWSSLMVREVNITRDIKVVKYGYISDSKDSKEYDIYSTNIAYKDGQTSFDLVIGKRKTRFLTNVISVGNIENLTGAIAVALHFEIDLSVIQKAILDLPVVEGSMQVIHSNNNQIIIDDSYNANPDGVINAITTGYMLAKDNQFKFTIVLDDILELGSQSVNVHQKIAALIQTLKPSRVYLVGRNFRQIVQSGIDAKATKVELIDIDNPSSVTTIQKTLSKLKGVVLYEGRQSGKLKPIEKKKHN
jgi:UDP-N-acetylmuramoyl-tripeptide--D-alanyl-D-alanine ligase